MSIEESYTIYNTSIQYEDPSPMSAVSVKQVSVTPSVQGVRTEQVEKASIETAAATVRSCAPCSVLSHPKQASHHPIDILPALDLLVFDLELCLIPAALEEEGEEVPNEPFPAANMPELAYELYRGEERSAEGAAK